MYQIGMIIQYNINFFLDKKNLECINSRTKKDNKSSVISVGSHTHIPPHPSVLVAQIDPKNKESVIM